MCSVRCRPRYMAGPVRRAGKNKNILSRSMIREVFQRSGTQPRHATQYCALFPLFLERAPSTCALAFYIAVTTPTRIAPRTVAAAAFSLRFREKSHSTLDLFLSVRVTPRVHQKTLMPRVIELCFLFARARERVKYGH
jgi:hypothetical protein